MEDDRCINWWIYSENLLNYAFSYNIIYLGTRNIIRRGVIYMGKGILERKDVDERYTWDLSAILN